MVAAEQRFSRDQRCPVCDGNDRDHRGAGRRCYGFTSDDGERAHCTRSEYAGNLPYNISSQTYPHRLNTACPCGLEHGEYRAPVVSLNRAQRRARTRPASGDRRLVATYPYRDGDGALIFEVLRFDPKSFSQRRPDGHGGYHWNLDGVTPVLYHLPQLRAADPARPAFIVEGEKDTQALEALGLVATCNPGGAGKWRDEYSSELAGRHVVVLPDNDPAGEAHAAQVAESVRGWAASVRVVQLPGQIDHGDITDWLGNGWTVADLARLVDEATLPPNLAEPETEPPAPGPDGDGDELARLRAEIADLKRQIAELRPLAGRAELAEQAQYATEQERDAVWDLLLTPKRPIAVQAAAGALRTIHREYRGGKKDRDGWTQCFRGRLADEAGTNETAVTGGMALLREVGAVQESPDPADLSEHPRNRQRPATDYLTGLLRLRDACRERSAAYRENRGRKKNQPKKIRPCPVHPLADATAICEVTGCGEVLATGLPTAQPKKIRDVYLRDQPKKIRLSDCPPRHDVPATTLPPPSAGRVAHELLTGIRADTVPTANHADAPWKMPPLRWYVGGVLEQPPGSITRPAAGGDA